MAETETFTYRRRRRHGPPNNLGLLVALLGLGLMVAAVFFVGSRRGGPGGTGDLPLTPGARIYSQNCAGCHGPDGAGNTAVGAPALNAAGNAWRLSDGQIQRNIQAGGGHVMPAFADKLSNDEIEDVIRHMQTWWTAEQITAQRESSASDPIQR